MKIHAFGVRDDEKQAFEQISAQCGVEVTLSDETPSLENADLVKGYEGVTVLGMGNIDRDLLSRYSENGVRFLSTRTIGYNHIDLVAAKELGIKVCNAAYPPNGVADFTVMMILMCLRQYKQALWRGQVNDFSLQGLQGRDMNELTIGVMGTGRIGLQVLKNLSGFGCRLLAYDVYKNPEAEKIATYVDQDTIYKECDVISLHMPLFDSTYHIINHETIAKMKDGVILINCARGGLTDIDALVDGVESEKIGALGMDTVEGEEGIVHEDRRTDIISNRNWFYLHQFRNVIMTQHRKEKDLVRLAELANRYGVIVYSDEIFADNCYQGLTCQCYLDIKGAKSHAIVATGLGKSFGFTGVNHANIIIADDELRARFTDRRTRDHYGSLDPCVYECVLSAYTKDGKAWVDASNAYVWENMCVLRDYFAKHLPKARVCGGEGAYILWIDWSAYFSSGDELNEFLVKKAHVCLGEGSDYDSPLFTRVCMATPRKCLIKTLESIGEAFSKLGKEK